MSNEPTYTSFAGSRRIAHGSLAETVRRTKLRLDKGIDATVLVFEDQTGQQVDFDWRGTPDEVVERLDRHPHLARSDAPPARRSGPGRPKLGVVSREVSLLPRHWTWLGEQPGGASAALRRLVDDARKRTPIADRRRRAREAASRFLSAMAGDRRGFEEATRALFAGDRERLAALMAPWPADIRSHVDHLLDAAERTGAAIVTES